MKPRKLELLAPAANSETAIQAILHGADAVYIGPPSHGARKAASNSIADIERVVEFAHQFRAKVYATVNTIIYDDEITKVEQLCRDLYHAGVDALIVQDMGILRMKIPPIALHASTQCDIRTPEKAKFLEEVGFSQLVLARELTLHEIKAITSAVSIPVETFVHGALCVCYSGRCHASFAINGRSANRGECAQVCRYPFTLIDSSGKIIKKDKYLLSLKDFNASHNIEDLVNAGVSSFKIEGRLKETGYVKNITALYHKQLNQIIRNSGGELSRSSFGKVVTEFSPDARKSFNRGFTDYFLSERKPLQIASMLTPKSQGEPIRDLSQINNGDGISFFDNSGKFVGVNVNRVDKNRILPARKIEIPRETQIYRTFDVKWDKLMQSATSQRSLALSVTIDDNGITGVDERGVAVRLPLNLNFEKAQKKPDYKNIFEKLGNTVYYLDSFHNNLDPQRFYRISELTSLRRELINLQDTANRTVYPYDYRRKENPEAKYPFSTLDYRDNVSNRLAEEFYYQHGVNKIEKAMEVSKDRKPGKTVMTTRHCILRELGMCRMEKGNSRNLKFPLYLNYDSGRFRLDFDCKNCEMKVVTD